MITVVSEAEFKRFSLRDLVHAHTGPLSVLFVTYNNIEDVKQDGVQDTGYDDLRIVVQTASYRVPDIVTIGLIAGASLSKLDPASGLEMMEFASSLMHETGEEAQKEVESKLSDPDSLESDIVFVYVGVSGFDGAIQFADRVARANPDTKVIVLSCDCNSTHRFYCSDLAKHLHQVVITPECGGRGALGQIYEEINRLWGLKIESLDS